MRLLITGAGGLLGANLALHAASSHQVVASGRFHALRSDGLEWRYCNLVEPQSDEDLVLSVRPDAIFHCAALTDVDVCEKEPDKAYALHVEATRRLARSATQVGARFFVLSTDSVFDGRSGGYTEDSSPAPLNVYARTKREGEIAALENCPQTLVIRTNIYGWNAQKKQSLSEWILNRLEGGESLTGFADVRFCPISVGDLSRTLMDLLFVEARGILHLAGGEDCSKLEFARALAREFELDASLIRVGRLVDAGLQAPRPLNTTLCCKRATALLKYALPDVTSGLRLWRGERDNGWQKALKNALSNN